MRNLTADLFVSLDGFASGVDARAPSHCRTPVDAVRRRVSIGRVTAKEKLLDRAPHWTEEQAERALRAAEGDLDEWGDLRAQTEALAEQAETRLRERERAAGDAW
jgi:hypothetical protein